MIYYRVMTGAIRGIDKVRNVTEELQSMGYTQLKVADVGGFYNLYCVEVYTGHNKDKVDKAREDIERATGKRATVQTRNVL